MRVITGKARGVQLKTPDGMTTRPTTDRVKEALFSIIQFEIPTARVLDLFGGTGQLGIEALSRGAKSAVFVEHRLRLKEDIRRCVQNAMTLSLTIEDASVLVSMPALCMYRHTTGICVEGISKNIRTPLSQKVMRTGRRQRPCPPLAR